MKSTLFLLLLPIITQTAFGQTTHYDITYQTTASLAKQSGFSARSKIVIYVDPQCPVEHRTELAKVEPAAKKKGVDCTSGAEADFVIVVTTDTYSHPKSGDGYELFGIKGNAFRLSNNGTKRSEESVWDCSVVGREGTYKDWGHELPPPWVDVDTIVEKFVSSIGIEVHEPNSASEEKVSDSPITVKGVTVETPPQELSVNLPTIQSFNQLLQEFFGSELFDMSKDGINPAFVQSFSNETPNGLYRILKLKERGFKGAILVGPVVEDNNQTIVVTARIVYKHGFIKTMYSRSVFIEFSATNKLLGVDKGPYMKQDL